MKPLSVLLKLTLISGLFTLAISHSAAHALAPSVTQPQVQNPARVLFVGNSYFYYNNSLHNHVRRMVGASNAELDKRIQYKSATIGGASLDHHNIDWLTQTGRIGVKEPFELVILAGNSGDALKDASRAKFAQTVAQHNQVITNRGGKTALYMTPAYVPPHKELNPNNVRKIENMYVQVANDIQAIVIPVGLAFEEAYRRYPELKLHDKEDGSHPSPLGTYLAACTVVASLYSTSPVGNPYTMYGAIPTETATQLQQVAQDVVRQFFGRK
ncbi:MAG TPA: hypothetical protein PKC80_12555 [Burkholderiaceae bacterium]|nr:hypothetical protein [Burkholderiaceae bacterium]